MDNDGIGDSELHARRISTWRRGTVEGICPLPSPAIFINSEAHSWPGRTARDREGWV
jgi:hypothetical protein